MIEQIGLFKACSPTNWGICYGGLKHNKHIGVVDASARFLYLAEETNVSHNSELGMVERQELQIKKEKLVAMLEEVHTFEFVLQP